MADARRASTARRLAWFVGIWVASVATLAIVAGMLRWWLQA